MLVTVENQQATAMNQLGTEDHGVGTARTLATGGGRVDPLPFPFNHVVLLENGAAGGADAKQLAMHQGDWNHKQVPWLTHAPREEWNMLVQAGKVTLAFAAETGVTDSEELFAIAAY